MPDIPGGWSGSWGKKSKQTLSEHPSFLPHVHRGLWLPVRRAGCGEKNDAGTYGNQCGKRLGMSVGPQPTLASLFPGRAGRTAYADADAAPPPSRGRCWSGRVAWVWCRTAPAPAGKVTFFSDDSCFPSPNRAHPHPPRHAHPHPPAPHLGTPTPSPSPHFVPSTMLPARPPLF